MSGIGPQSILPGIIRVRFVVYTYPISARGYCPARFIAFRGFYILFVIGGMPVKSLPCNFSALPRGRHRLRCCLQITARRLTSASVCLETEIALHRFKIFRTARMLAAGQYTQYGNSFFVNPLTKAASCVNIIKLIGRCGGIGRRPGLKIPWD